MSYNKMQIIPSMFLVTLMVSSLQGRSQSSIQCRSSSQCGTSRCCVLVYTSQGTTSCESLQRKGAQCHPLGQESLNLTLGLPSGSSLTLTDVYQSICPCENGSSCIRGTCVTRDVSNNNLR